MCEWREPEKVLAPIQNYHVNITHGGASMLQMSTKILALHANIKLVQRELYTVTVMAHLKGPVAKTQVRFTNSGELISHFSPVIIFELKKHF